MSWFNRWIRRPRAIFLAAPLLVTGVLWWQRQLPVESGDQPIADASSAQATPPFGISGEEWDAARGEFDVIADSALHCSSEEMPAYWRLLKWIARETDDDSKSNQFMPLAFNDLVNRPNRLRGRPVQVHLHICRIVSYAAPENSLGIERLYELWGWSEDSRGSLYVAIAPNLPSGMNAGERVSERGTLCGYFFKVQGYLAAGSASGAVPSAAPLLIGRLESWNPPVTVIAKTNDFWPAAAGLLLAVSFVGLLIQRPLFRSRQRESVAQVARHGAAKLETWLDSERSIQA